MVSAELKKLKRHYLIPLSVSVVFFSALLAVFQMIAASNSATGYLALTEGILWNNVTLVFPFLLTFFGGFLMNREYSEDTLKSNLIVPISYRKLRLIKIAVTALATILFVAVSFICSILFAVILQYPFSLRDLGTAFWELFVTGVSCLIAVFPLIAFFTLKRNFFLAGTCGAFVYGFCGIFVADTRLTSWYPTTAALTIIKYNPDSANYQFPVALFVLVMCVLLSFLVIAGTRRQQHD